MDHIREWLPIGVSHHQIREAVASGEVHASNNVWVSGLFDHGIRLAREWHEPCFRGRSLASPRGVTMSRTPICRLDLQEFGDRSKMTYDVRRARHPMPDRSIPKTDSIGQS